MSSEEGCPVAGLPLIVHVGKLPPLLEDVFDLLAEGDVITHAFMRNAGVI